MKKKQLNLEKKIFLKKDVIGSLTSNEQFAIVGGNTVDLVGTVNAACTSKVLCDAIPPDGGTYTIGASLCGTVVWRTFDTKTSCR